MSATTTTTAHHTTPSRVDLSQWTRKCVLNLPRSAWLIELDMTTDPRKQGVPYAAKLLPAAKGSKYKVGRKFYELEREYGRHSVTVFGEIEVRPGDITEIREGGSWKNEYRQWSLVMPDGELHAVADISSSRQKTRVIRWLSGKVSLGELLDGHQHRQALAQWQEHVDQVVSTASVLTAALAPRRRHRQ